MKMHVISKLVGFNRALPLTLWPSKTTLVKKVTRGINLNVWGKLGVSLNK
jgi:hypothetical protein